MKFLIIDRDTVTTELVKMKLQGLGHEVVEQPVKNDAMEYIKRDRFDGIFLDPAPLNNARPIVAGLRRAVNYMPYVVLLSEQIAREEGLKAGANDVISKPVAGDTLTKVVANAARLIGLVEHLGNDKEDFPSAGGIIAKSAVNQLFLSAIERADRYAETTFAVFIGIDNYQEIFDLDGPTAASYSAAKLSKYLVRIRRQSDIIAQTGKSEYCLLLQRPRYDTEPLEAARRLANSLRGLTDITDIQHSRVNVSVRLVDVPSGNEHAHYELSYDLNGIIEQAIA